MSRKMNTGNKSNTSISFNGRQRSKITKFNTCKDKRNELLTNKEIRKEIKKINLENILER